MQYSYGCIILSIMGYFCALFKIEYYIRHNRVGPSQRTLCCIQNYQLYCALMIYLMISILVCVYLQVLVDSLPACYNNTAVLTYVHSYI